MGINLGGAKLRAYRPSVMGGAWWSAILDGKPIFSLWMVERMRRDPMVQFCMRVLRAPIAAMKIADRGIQGQPTIKVVANSREVQEFVEGVLHLLWNTTLVKIMKFLEWGYSAGEIEFDNDDQGRWMFKTLNDVYPTDANLLQWKDGEKRGQFAGIAVSSHGQLDRTRKHYIYQPWAFWCSGESEFGSFYGRPRLAGMYEPWLEKRGRNGACDSRRLWYRKNAFRGGTIRYPLGMTDFGTPEQPDIRNNQDVGRQIVEWAENGGVKSLPNTPHADLNMAGKYAWEFQDPASFPDVAGLREYPQDLDREIQQGAGIPPEVIQAAEGSGLSQGGRSIPAIVFFSSEDELVKIIITTMVQQVINPIVGVNFGERARYAIQPESLAALAQKNGDAANNLVAGARGPESAPAPQPVAAQGREDGALQMSLALVNRVKQLAALEYPDLQPVQLDFDESKIKRDADGKFSETEGRKPGKDEDGGDEGGEQKAGFIRRRYNKLKGRYGETGAKLVLAGMIALAPTPIPGSSFIPVALAEAVKRVRSLFRNRATTEAVSMSVDDVEELARVILEELEGYYKDAGEEVPAEIDLDAARAVAEQILGEAEPLDMAFDESKHPRGDDGRFIPAGEIEAAKSDPAKAAELRGRVTDPEQRKKLEAALGGSSASTPPATPAPEAIAQQLASLTPEQLASVQAYIAKLLKPAAAEKPAATTPEKPTGPAQAVHLPPVAAKLKDALERSLSGQLVPGDEANAIADEVDKLPLPQMQVAARHVGIDPRRDTKMALGRRIRSRLTAGQRAMDQTAQ